jgi:hypothetical protein
MQFDGTLNPEASTDYRRPRLSGGCSEVLALFRSKYDRKILISNKLEFLESGFGALFKLVSERRLVPVINLMSRYVIGNVRDRSTERRFKFVRIAREKRVC